MIFKNVFIKDSPDYSITVIAVHVKQANCHFVFVAVITAEIAAITVTIIVIVI